MTFITITVTMFYNCVGLFYNKLYLEKYCYLGSIIKKVMISNNQTKKITLYEKVAENVSRLIDEGTFRVGDRIPSLRKLSSQLKVSITTVLEAYRHLEDKGILEARQQSGYYVRAQYSKIISQPEISEPEISPTKVSISEIIRMIMRESNNPNIIHLGYIQPDPDLLPIHKLNLTLSNVVRRNKRSSILYDCLQGYKPLRIQISRRLLSTGCTVTPNEIIITSGCEEAIMLSLLSICSPGDTVAVESPVYFHLLLLLEILGLKVVEIPSHPRDGIILEVLRMVIEDYTIKACFTTPNFNIPLGSCIPDENKKILVNLLSEYKIPLIEDDENGDIHFSFERPIATKSFDKKGLVIYCSSFSNTLAPGYRVGWILPGRFKADIELSKNDINVSCIYKIFSGGNKNNPAKWRIFSLG